LSRWQEGEREAQDTRLEKAGVDVRRVDGEDEEDEDEEVVEA